MLNFIDLGALKYIVILELGGEQMKKLTLEKRCKGLYVDCGHISLQKYWIFLLSNIKISQREACDLDKLRSL